MKWLLVIYASLFFFFGFQLVPVSIIIHHKARTEIKNILQKMNINKVTVQLDGTETKQKQEIFEALKKLQHIDNKGGRTHRVQCEISDGKENVLLVISQSALFDNAYVIYYPKYHMTKRNVVGGFYSESIDLKNP